MARRRQWDADKLQAVIDRMRAAEEASDLQHCLSLLDAFEIIVLEEMGADADKTFSLIKQLRIELNKEIERWQKRKKFR